jgi:hypothetical protein
MEFLVFARLSIQHDYKGSNTEQIILAISSHHATSCPGICGQSGDETY